MLLEDFYKLGDTSTNEGIFYTTLHINKQHLLYKGHFPHRPVTPGVMLMQLFKEEAERISGHKLQMEKAVNVKFMAVVDPNEDEELLLESQLEETNGVISLKGTAKHKGAIALKINSLYTIQN